MPNIEKYEELFHACKCGDVDALKKLEEAGFTKNDSEACPFLTILYFSGVDKFLERHLMKSESDVRSRAYQLLAEEERRLSSISPSKATPADSILWYLLGIFYERGWGLFSQDDAQAFKYFAKSSDCNYGPAICKLGNIYYNGSSTIATDYSKCMEFYKKSSEEHDYYGAHFNMGIIYEFGKGIFPNKDEGYKYYEKAAEKGVPMAISYMWKWYDARGEKALMTKYLKMAIERNSVEATSKYVEMLGTDTPEVIDESLSLLANSLLPQSLSVLHEDITSPIDIFRISQVISLLLKRFQQGIFNQNQEKKVMETANKVIDNLDARNIVAFAHLILGIGYSEGRGVEKDFTEATRAFELAADRGNGEAAYRLGMLYHEGMGDQLPDYSNAKIWFEKAKSLSNTDGYFMMGMYYLEGLGDLQLDEDKAYRYFKRAGVEGHKRARYMYGLASLQGFFGVSRDLRFAYSWLKSAANSGDTDAMYNVGMMYMRGQVDGTGPDRETGISWLEKAAIAGDTDAMYNLALCLLGSSMSGEEEEEEENDGEGLTGNTSIIVTEEDKVKAENWLHKAMELGDVDAQVKWEYLQSLK